MREAMPGEEEKVEESPSLGSSIFLQLTIIGIKVGPGKGAFTDQSGFQRARFVTQPEHRGLEVSILLFLQLEAVDEFLSQLV